MRLRRMAMSQRAGRAHGATLGRRGDAEEDGAEHQEDQQQRRQQRRDNAQQQLPPCSVRASGGRAGTQCGLTNETMTT
jgi:hypothetical protein